MWDGYYVVLVIAASARLVLAKELSNARVRSDARPIAPRVGRALWARGKACDHLAKTLH